MESDEGHPSSFRRSLQEIEEWLISGEVRKDESELGRALTDLKSLDKNGKLELMKARIFWRLEDIAEKTCKVSREKIRYVDWLISANGIEDDAAREILSELIFKHQEWVTSQHITPVSNPQVSLFVIALPMKIGPWCPVAKNATLPCLAHRSLLESVFL